MGKPNTLFKRAYNAALDLAGDSGSLPSDAALGARLGVSRTTVRGILARFAATGVVGPEPRARTVLRTPEPADYFPDAETDTVSAVIERAFLARVFSAEAQPGSQLNEADLAREIGVSTSALREFLIRFSRYGLIEKKKNRHWVLKGFTEAFALELFEIREMFELRSARAFLRMPAGHPSWEALDHLEAEHRMLLGRVGERYREFPDLDDRFHRLVHAASRNRFIIDFHDVISLVFHYHYQWSRQDERERNRVAITEHLSYITALKSRSDLDVEYFCRKHLASAKQTLLAALRHAGNGASEER
jgi:DNA-binding GntR family transcriptional regulator